MALISTSSAAAIPPLLSRLSPSSNSCSATTLMLAFFERKPQLSHTTSPIRSHAERLRGLNRRDLFVLPFLSISLPDSALGLLEGDEDEDLLNKAKLDRQKRLERRETLNSLKKETASVQKAVYNLSRVGEALDVSDYTTAIGIMGTSSSQDADWIAQLKDALLKVSRNNDEKVEADQCTSSLSSLQTAVLKQETNSSRSAFVASASALEKWSLMTGIFEQIKGL